MIDDATDLPCDVYLVGGTVRDLILGREFLDVDLAVDGDGLALANKIGTPSGTETRFGTLSVTSDGYRYDLARTRSERYPHPGALPEVAPAGSTTTSAPRFHRQRPGRRPDRLTRRAS